MKTPRHDIRRRPALRAGICTALMAGLLCWSVPAAAAIQANLESPATNFPASGIGNVQGWAYSTTPGAKIDRLIEVQIDSDAPFRVPCCSSRGDVEAAVPGAPLNTGFSGVFNFQRLSEGAHSIKVTIKASSNAGTETKTITSNFDVVKLSPYKFLRAFRWKNFDPRPIVMADCESLNGLDPAHGNAGAVCNHTRAVSKAAGNPTADCDGTIQFAYSRGSQTFMPISGCDPQGTLGGGDSESGPVIDFNPGGVISIFCFNAVSNMSVSVDGLVPTFTFKTQKAASVGIKVWEKGKVGQDIVAFGVGPKATEHKLKPFPLGSVIKPGTKYEYEITVKSNCASKPDLKVMGPSSFATKKRVVRAYIDKAHILEDGDDDFIVENYGEVTFLLVLRHSSLKPYGWKQSGSPYYGVEEGDVVHSPASIGWSSAAVAFDLEVAAGEHDWGQFCDTVMACDGPIAEQTLSFDSWLTYAGGTYTKTLTLTKDNLKVKVWVRVVVTYE